jgi:hypothetical protein
MTTYSDPLAKMWVGAKKVGFFGSTRVCEIHIIIRFIVERKGFFLV